MGINGNCPTQPHSALDETSDANNDYFEFGFNASFSRHLIECVELLFSLDEPSNRQSRLSERQSFKNRLEDETVLVLYTHH